MQLIDTHCHIHSVDYPIPIEEVSTHCREVGVDGLICVGTDAADSARAVEFVRGQNCWASIGQHPHEAKYGIEPLERLRTLLPPHSSMQDTSWHKSEAVQAKVEDGAARQSKIVAIGECGLDYFYGHSSKKDQEKALRYQIELALEYQLPLIFHVRDAFDDFWPIFDSYRGIRGELHSFTDNSANLSKALTRGLYIGVNGILTFTKNSAQLEVAKQIPKDRLLLETDSPFLTPVPLRGKVNEPARVIYVAEFLAELRSEPFEELSACTASNAQRLFSL
jgi:TatD DNase family protein